MSSHPVLGRYHPNFGDLLKGITGSADNVGFFKSGKGVFTGMAIVGKVWNRRSIITPLYNNGMIMQKSKIGIGSHQFQKFLALMAYDVGFARY